MGESGSRRSTLVSRLPIFRRSSSKRQESLPSSPSSGGQSNGVHTSSPSSTNSSSGSTGKRRSLFRAPSLSFSAKRNSDPRVQPINLNLTPPLTQSTDANGNNQQTTPGVSEGAGRPKSRHSFGFGSHKQKKITRSQTEDFEKVSSSSSTANRNVFIKCISGSGANEGDDSGFLDDYSVGGSNNTKRSSRKKQLLPKSFSAHHRFSRTSDHHRPPEVNLEPPSSTNIAPPGAGGLSPGSGSGELPGAGGESSLQSPMISEDQTTAITPSEFIPITEDSASEVDALPTPSPGPGFAPGSTSVPGLPIDTPPPEPPPAPENFSLAVSTSQVFFTAAQSSTEKPLLPDTSTANNTDYETAISLSEPETAVPCLPLREQSLEERQEREEERKEAQDEVSAKERMELVEERKASCRKETTSESEACVARSEGCHSNPEQSERRARNVRSIQERGSFCGCHEPRSSHLRKPHAASLCSSVSPYHEVMRMERRLRSSSEGAGGPRIHGNQRDAPGMEGCGLLKQRNNSSSSKLGSLDVLNYLGSSELDEDDLMLDLDLSDDQRHRHVSREDSSQSLASCLNLLPSPMDPSGERIPGRENNQREPSRPTSLLPADWSSGLALGREDEPLPPGLETFPLRLMQQDCTAVKTLLLRLRRTLQESTETSPASSLQSLPISPCSEKSLPFKEPGREEAVLQQLREKDELILRLLNELESAKAAQKMKDCQMTDRATQTEHMGPETSHPGRWSGLGSSILASRDRRVVRGVGAALGGDLCNQHLPHHYPSLHGRPPASERHAAREERHCQGVLAHSTARNPAPNLAPAPSNLSCATSAASAQTSLATPAQLPVSHLGHSPNQCPGSGSAGAKHNAIPSLSSRWPEGVSSSSESLTPGAGGGVSLSGGARRGGGGVEHHPPSHIPRVVGASASSSLHSLASRESPSPSISSPVQTSPPPPTPSPASSSSSSSSSTFTGRLGQPPRGPLSLHSYSRKNVFLQHSLQTAELQALTQRDS
ncbi:serine-rich coiled-coil domain-containing protein 1 [Cyclopterus lumpus]|uniref:Coiled-coil serine rich protein 1 n=1 Tax=Cyclopterus lumpus TaxID=8103 RepID=A0A8C2WH04_CYCLU|nr:serine-rich coiled-coil domain-containing protein 1 [Cyclopterus lumpus]XP_034397479.1 serine-rich coiled-coil domain-containing protein 1 [Cyclopterus lumpus]